MAAESAQPFTLGTVAGRVLEARVFWLNTVQDAIRYSEAVAAAVAKFPSNVRPILCADHRPVVIYPQPVTDRLIALFTNMNTRLDRIAILVARSNATLSLQLSRIVRQAGYERRRVFHDSPEALAYLAPELNAVERARVRVFLAEFEPPD